MAKHQKMVHIRNNAGTVITEIKFLHRYDSDIYEHGERPLLDTGAEDSIGTATYWTGFLERVMIISGLSFCAAGASIKTFLA